MNASFGTASPLVPRLASDTPDDGRLELVLHALGVGHGHGHGLPDRGLRVGEPERVDVRVGDHDLVPGCRRVGLLARGELQAHAGGEPADVDHVAGAVAVHDVVRVDRLDGLHALHAVHGGELVELRAADRRDDAHAPRRAGHGGAGDRVGVVLAWAVTGIRRVLGDLRDRHDVLGADRRDGVVDVPVDAGAEAVRDGERERADEDREDRQDRAGLRSERVADRGADEVEGLHAGHRLVLDDAPVADVDAAVAPGRELLVVRDDDQRDALLAVQAEEDVLDDRAGGGVEVAGRLVREDDPRVVHERAGDDRPLLLPSREVHGGVLRLVGELELLERREATAAALPAPDARDLQREDHVLEHRGVGREEELLEDEAERGVPRAVEPRPAQRRRCPRRRARRRRRWACRAGPARA